MKKVFVLAFICLIVLTSCEVEYREGITYHHWHGYERRHYPLHHEVYNHGYHHDHLGNEIIIERR